MESALQIVSDRLLRCGPSEAEKHQPVDAHCSARMPKMHAFSCVSKWFEWFDTTWHDFPLMDKTQIHKNPHDELRCAWTRPGIDPGLASFTVSRSGNPRLRLWVQTRTSLIWWSPLRTLGNPTLAIYTLHYSTDQQSDQKSLDPMSTRFKRC